MPRPVTVSAVHVLDHNQGANLWMNHSTHSTGQQNLGRLHGVSGPILGTWGLAIHKTDKTS